MPFRFQVELFNTDNESITLFVDSIEVKKIVNEIGKQLQTEFKTLRGASKLKNCIKHYFLCQHGRTVKKSLEAKSREKKTECHASITVTVVDQASPNLSLSS